MEIQFSETAICKILIQFSEIAIVELQLWKYDCGTTVLLKNYSKILSADPRMSAVQIFLETLPMSANPR